MTRALRTRGLLLGIGLALFGVMASGAMASGASAQDLTDRATERCVQAAVRLEVDLGRSGTSTGSGSIIDARGYILTNFHVVGLSRHETGMGAPGTLYGDGAHVRVATVSSARDSARAQYLGRVVRGDIRLDMAIVRIVSMADGSPLPAGTVFPTIEMTDTTGINPGAAVWAFGFPMGVRTINVTSGNISGFEMNTDSEVAWIRTDVEFNPGNSGGMLVDRQGRLIAVPTAVVSGRDTLEPIELARPVERMPTAWRAALASAVPIDDVVITGVTELTTAAELTDSAAGDTSGLGREEIHYYALPASAAAGMVTVTTTPPMPVALINARGTVVREGRGTLMIGPGEATGGAIALLLERTEDGTATPVSLRTVVTTRPVATAPPSAGAGYPAAPGGYPGYPPGYAGGAAGSGAGSASASAVVVRGRLVDERTGAPVVGGVIYIAPAGVDLVSMLALWQGGRISEAQFRAALVGYAISDATGAYAIANLPRGRFSGASAASGYATAPLTLTISPTDTTVIDVTPIRMRR